MEKYKPTGLIIYNQESGITAKKLAANLKLKAIKNDESIIALHNRLPIKIRYGNSHLKQRHDTKYNSVETILLCSNSLAFSNFCQNNNILSPIYTPINRMEKKPNFPFLVREKYHRAGRDIQIIETNKDLTIQMATKFHVPFIPTKYEIRIHYILGNVERIFLKEPGPDTDIKYPIRSSNFGWHYKGQAHQDENRYTKARELALQVAEITGLQFGAFDMAWVPQMKKYIIWEINTAPGLNDHTLEIYTNLLRKII